MAFVFYILVTLGILCGNNDIGNSELQELKQEHQVSIQEWKASHDIHDDTDWE